MSVSPLEELRAAVAVLRDTTGAARGRLDSNNQELLALVAVLLRIREPVATWLEAEIARLETPTAPGWHEVVGRRALAVARAVLTTKPQERPGPAEPGPVIDNARAALAQAMGVTYP
ncbi:hypothetical protein [Streptomyces sp. NBC_00670]|jgi:hypothetical protein|uniref:hypothetical protein n=1 Tax=Streptomyces sp. NBC_00670 TaxID=2975804 RepID=UPI002E381CCE|nr:hypothetical protein [Streptomyces sp. NBC_00670]